VKCSPGSAPLETTPRTVEMPAFGAAAGYASSGTEFGCGTVRTEMAQTARFSSVRFGHR